MMRVGSHTNASPARTTPPPPAPAGGLPLAFAILPVSGRPTLGRCGCTQDCRDLLCTSTSAVLMVSAPVDMSLKFANGPLSPARQGSLRAMQSAFHSRKGGCPVPYCGVGGHLKGLTRRTSDRAWACHPHSCLHECIRSNVCELSQPVSIEYSGVCSSIQASCAGHLDKRKWRLEFCAAACSAAVVIPCNCTPDNAGMCMLQLAAHQVIGVQAPAHLLSSCMTLHAHAHAGWLAANPADGRCSSQCGLCSEAATKRCMRVTLRAISQHAATPNAVLSPHGCHLMLASYRWQGENPCAQGGGGGNPFANMGNLMENMKKAQELVQVGAPFIDRPPVPASE